MTARSAPQVLSSRIRERQTAASTASMPNPRPWRRGQAPKPHRGAPKAQGLTAAIAVAGPSPVPSIAPDDPVSLNSTGADVPMCAFATSRIYTSLTGTTVLGQVATDEKSNEITAVPKLLEMLSLKGTIVTTDALNCQRAIAQQIVDQGGDYALALKGNQGTLHDDVRRFLDDPASEVSTTAPVVDGDHGRIETRTATVSTDIEWLQDDHCWPGLVAIGKVDRIRETPGKTTTETAYYLLSTKLSADRFNEVVRSHWGVENQLHWRLDVVMNEDQDRTRLGNGPQNLAVLRHMALNVMQKDTSKGSLRGKFMRAGWDERYLARLITLF